MPTQQHARRFTVFLASITALTSISIDMSLPAVPAMEHALGQTAGRGALTLSVFLAGYAVTPLIGGPLADRFGRRPVLMASLGLFALSALACTVAHSFGMLLFFRLLQGCSSGVSVALPLAIVRDRLSGHEARQRISEVVTINGLMPLLAPILGAWVMLLGGWRFIFGVQALFATGVVLAVIFYFEESLPTDRRQTLAPRTLVRNYAALLGSRGFMGYATIYALIFACIFAYISESPLLLMQHLGIPRGRYTLLFAITAIGTICGALASSRMHRWNVSVRTLLSVGLAGLACLCVAMLGLHLAGVHQAWALVAPSFVALFGFGLMSPALTLEALETVPHLAGSGAGVLRSLQMIVGAGASALLAGICARPHVDAGTATISAMSIPALIAAATYFGLLRTRPLGGVNAGVFRSAQDDGERP